MELLLFSGNLLKEEIFMNHTILLSEEMFTIFDYYIHNRRYIEDIYASKMCAGFNFCLQLCVQNCKIRKIKRLIINSCNIMLSLPTTHDSI